MAVNPLSDPLKAPTKSLVAVERKADVSSNFWAQPPTSSAAITGVGLKQWMAEVEKAGLQLEAYHSTNKLRMQRPITKPTGAIRPLDEQPEPFPHRAGRGLPAAQRLGSMGQPKSNAELVLERLHKQVVVVDLQLLRIRVEDREDDSVGLLACACELAAAMRHE